MTRWMKQRGPGIKDLAQVLSLAALVTAAAPALAGCLGAEQSPDNSAGLDPNLDEPPGIATIRGGAGGVPPSKPHTAPAVVASSPGNPSIEENRPAVIAVMEGDLPYASHADFVSEVPPWPDDALPAFVNAPLVNSDAFGEYAFDALRLHQIPNSRVGAVFLSFTNPSQGPFTLEPIDHYTATMSRAGGATLGGCKDCLMVAVTGDIGISAAWISKQPWVDAVSVSLAGPITDRTASLDALQAMIHSGKPFFFSNGNLGVPDDRWLDAHYSSEGLAVGMSDVGGVHGGPGTQTPGADLLTDGYRIPVAQADGSVDESFGTSYAAPWAAGRYAQWLHDQWAAGTLERVVEDGRVRNRMMVDAWNEVPGLEDGYIDGPDVRQVLANAASGRGEVVGDYWGNEVSYSDMAWPDDSFYLGYGALTGEAWSWLANWTVHEGREIEPGDAHQSVLERRALTREVHQERTRLLCEYADWIGLCPRKYLDNDDWYS